MKKKLAIFFPLLFTAWFIITVYFYCQHYRVVKSYVIEKEIAFPDITVIIKEITIEAYRPNRRIEEMQLSFSGPWYYTFARKLPRWLQIPLVKTCYFYSTPYEYGDYGTLTLKGILLVKPDTHYTDWDLMDAVDIYLYDEDMKYYGNSMGITKNSSSNYYLFSVEGKAAPLHKKAYKIIVKDMLNDDSRSLTIAPQWEKKTYTFYDKRPEQYEFDPFNIIDSFLSPMRQGKRDEARKYLQPGEEKPLWAALDHGYWEMGGNDYVVYEGRRGGFERVYSSNITFGRYESGYSPEELIPVASQKIYFVIRGGSPLVIDADPVTILPGKN